MFHFAAPAPSPLSDFTCPAGSRSYRLHVPPARVRGLVLLLHGCGQRAEGFARTSGLEAAAARQGWLTLTPEQSRRRNVLGCWNWFLPEHRAREGGEAAILAALTRETAAAHGVATSAIFVAGFSAGAAMALVLAESFPGLFAAACAHSGVHYAGIAGSDAAFAAMRGDFAGPGPRPRRKVPVLAIQGTEDRTVHPANARRITSGRSRRDRLVMVAGSGHEWSEGAAAEAIGFFRVHAGTSSARRSPPV